MPSIEDFCGDLYNGAKEVKVPKSLVTEISPGWYSSRYNLPHRGSSGAMRNGRLHAHDLGDHWSVHLDRVDPKKHSMGHLIADAPLILFIWSGFLTAMLMAKEDLDPGWALAPENIVLSKRDSRRKLAIGLLLVFFGTLAVLDPWIELYTVVVLIPFFIMFLGGLLIFEGCSAPAGKGRAKMFGGMAVIMFGFLGLALPGLILILMLVFIVFWTLASGIYLLVLLDESKMTWQDKLAPLVLGSLSFVFGALLIYNMQGTLILFLQVIGGLAILIGSFFILASLGVARTVRNALGQGKV